MERGFSDDDMHSEMRKRRRSFEIRFVQKEERKKERNEAQRRNRERTAMDILETNRPDTRIRTSGGWGVCT